MGREPSPHLAAQHCTAGSTMHRGPILGRKASSRGRSRRPQKRNQHRIALPPSNSLRRHATSTRGESQGGKNAPLAKLGGTAQHKGHPRLGVRRGRERHAAARTSAACAAGGGGGTQPCWQPWGAVRGHGCQVGPDATMVRRSEKRNPPPPRQGREFSLARFTPGDT